MSISVLSRIVAASRRRSRWAKDSASVSASAGLAARLAPAPALPWLALEMSDAMPLAVRAVGTVEAEEDVVVVEEKALPRAWALRCAAVNAVWAPCPPCPCAWAELYPDPDPAPDPEPCPDVCVCGRGGVFEPGACAVVDAVSISMSISMSAFTLPLPCSFPCVLVLAACVALVCAAPASMAPSSCAVVFPWSQCEFEDEIEVEGGIAL